MLKINVFSNIRSQVVLRSFQTDLGFGVRAERGLQGWAGRADTQGAARGQESTQSSMRSSIRKVKTNAQTC